MAVLQERMYAAPATWLNINVGIVRNTAILRRLANDWFLRCAPPPKEIAYMQRFAEDRIQGSC
jgi:hypothetical protein